MSIDSIAHSSQASKPLTPSARARIGILVVAYNAESTLRSVLERIPSAVLAKIEEIVVFDDTSQDRTFEVGEYAAFLAVGPSSVHGQRRDQPFRPDSLSYLAWLATRGGPVLSGTVAFVAAAAALVPALWLTPRTPSGAATGVALVYFAFFAFNKQAFANYYLFVIGSLCCAVGAAQVETGTSREVSVRRD